MNQRVAVSLTCALTLAGTLAQTQEQQAAANGVRTIYADHYDVSPPLRSLKPRPPRLDKEEHVPLKIHPARPFGSAPDLALRSVPSPLVVTTPGLSFDGVGVGLGGYDPNSAPPDTNGSVGLNQYVQWVNTAFGVFNKSTGALIYGPADGSTLWQGFGGPCEFDNDGDAIALYDKAANRWVMTQFAVSAQPYMQCLAVSTTSDATGTFRRFSFSFGSDFPDYPKVGVWPDAYYVTFNIFFQQLTFSGSRACAWDRNQMITANGVPGPMVCFQTSSAFGGLLPADLDGSTPPPAGSPNFVMSYDFNNLNRLNLWKFHVNFITPSSSTFTGPTTIPVTPYVEPCGGGGTCIQQPGGTDQTLDSLGDRLMYRLPYRNMGTNEVILLNHTVTNGSSTGVRWYEVRNPGGTPTLFQQGTFAPDSNFRWMGSIAMDKAGNIALGYSTSNSSNVFPSVRYTGRNPGDPAGTMQAENAVFAGSGSQRDFLFPLSRWGDYSSMSLDPVDDCTMYFTTEYLKATGTFNWSTRVVSFKFPACGGTATPDFGVAVSPTSGSVTQGANTTTTATVTSLNGFNAATTLSATGLPSGVTAGFAPNPVTPPSGGSANSTLTLTASASAATGTFPITVTGTSGALTHSATFNLTVNSSTQPDFSLSLTPTSRTVSPGQVATYTVNVLRVGGFSGAVSLTTSPAGGVFNPNPASGNSSTLTYQTSASTPPATYNFTVTGTSGSLTRTTSGTLVVSNSPPPDFGIAVSPASGSVTRGGTTTTTVTINSLNGFNAATTLSASGLPSGVTAGFAPNPVTPPGGGSINSTLTLSASATAATGTFPITVTGTSGSLTRSTTYSLTVNAVPPPPDFGIAVSPTSGAVTQGSNTTTTVTISSQNGFNAATTLSATGLPSGVTAGFAPNPVTPPGGGSVNSTLTLSASATAATGTFPITVTGTSGALTHSATFNLTVNSSTQADFSLSLTPTSRTVNRGQTATYTVNINRTGGFAGAVTFSANPAGGSFNPNPASGNSSTLSVAIPVNTPPGTYNFTVTGTSGSLTRTTTGSVIVQ